MDPHPSKMTSPPVTSPSANLVLNLRRELMRRAPFAQMTPAHVDRFIIAAGQAYYAPDETVLSPDSGPVAALMLVRQGSVSGRRGLADLAGSAGSFEYAEGDLFPVGAALAGRAVTATYTANEDTFCLLLPLAAMHALAAESAPFAEFLNHRVQHFLALSRRAVQAAWSSQTLAEQSLEARLATLPRKTPLSCAAATPLAEALAQMHERRVGSVMVVDTEGAPQGILTRHDILGRVTLPQRPLSTPIGEVMSAPIHALDGNRTLQEAALLMSRHGIRHVPVTDGGRLVNIVSERDLFAVQRLSLKQVSTQIRAARDLTTLQLMAVQIRRFAANLLGQGVQARQLTELISHLNDVLVERLVQLVAARHGLDLGQACWLAFGSEGRGEQTVATDQDNGLVFASNDPDADRPAWLAFAREVNDGLDLCGYPLCKGNIMAGNPACCLTAAEWQGRFDDWIEHGAPQDLLDASIYFDLRPVVGQAALAEPLREHIRREAARVPRFLKQMADNALTRRPPLNWRGGLDTSTVEGRETLDLKLQGTAIYVEAARLFALVHGLEELGTRQRLEAAARCMKVPAQEGQAWATGFDFLQMLRLRVQAGADAQADPLAALNPNLIDIGSLNDIDRRVLKESMRVARQLQQRIQLDWQR
jgi:CBS domain-containing protein